MDKPELQGIQLIDKIAPESDELVIAQVTQFTNEVVHCSLPMYNNHPAILPTRHMNIRRGRKVKDYVKVGQILVASIYTIHMAEKEDGTPVQQIDLSIKSIPEADKESTMNMYHRACKVHQIICGAGGYNRQAVDELYTQIRTIVRTIQQEQTDYDCYRWFEQILVGEQPCINDTLLKVIQQKIEMPSVTVEKEVRFQTNTPNGVQDIMDRLTRISSQAGVKVFVIAPPLYRITATAPTKINAEELLAIC
jgi:translation initiation factor 2 alpha subunit (eIF-2alpha)